MTWRYCRTPLPPAASRHCISRDRGSPSSLIRIPARAHDLEVLIQDEEGEALELADHYATYAAGGGDLDQLEPDDEGIVPSGGMRGGNICPHGSADGGIHSRSVAQINPSSG